MDVASRVGATIAGFIPLTNQYILEFADNRTLDGLIAWQRRVAAEPEIRRVDFNEHPRLTEPQTIDVFDNSQNWDSPDSPSRGAALDQISLHEAISLVRETFPFNDRGTLFDIHVAVIDSGFQPDAKPSEFQDASGHSFVEFLQAIPRFQPPSPFNPFASATLSLAYQAVDQTRYHDEDGHGTQVTSVIAARNDESLLSGVLNSLADKTETPFHVHVYDAALGGSHSMDAAKLNAALAHLATRTDVRIDVVNMSFGSYRSVSQAGCSAYGFEPLIQALSGKMLVVAGAGNDGVQARCFFPAALEQTSSHVVSVGAVAVANVDGTGEKADHRAIWGGSGRTPPSDGVLCDSGGPNLGSSNCEPGVTLVAPGEDVFAMAPSARGGYTTSTGFRGTSAAAPIVTGVAAILQAIRPSITPLRPSELRSILTSTATDITNQFGDPVQSGTPSHQIVRVNALAAVESLLPIQRADVVYATDQDAPSGVALPGAVIAIQVDALNGQPLPGPRSRTAIGLGVTKGNQTLGIGRPRTIVMSPNGRRLYVYASTDGPFGDGVVVIDTRSGKSIDFIPLGGGTFPPRPGAAPRSFVGFQQRPPMVVSKDGNLLYVSTGYSIRVVDTARRKVVEHFSDLPRPYSGRADDFSQSLLQVRLDRIQELLLNVSPTAAAGGTEIAALKLSPNGKTLYLIVGTGKGGGIQPGFVFALSVDLYTNPPNGGAALKPALDQYLTLNPHGGVQFSGNDSRAGSDEPAGAALSPDGKYLYVVNGGITRFSPADSTDLQTASYALDVVADTSNSAIDPSLGATQGTLNSVRESPRRPDSGRGDHRSCPGDYRRVRYLAGVRLGAARCDESIRRRRELRMAAVAQERRARAVADAIRAGVREASHRYHDAARRQPGARGVHPDR